MSLQAQQEAIRRFAAQFALKISQWFEEQETAAKRGRPIFDNILKQLRAGKAAGLIVHKIDRSARNLKDWAELGELAEEGIKVHFASEGLDLNSRGGRLSADIQAVVAADYVRNLREESIKGFYGRLKQGFYPRPAPLGYLDCGAGRPKIHDPERAPLVKRMFELYATGEYGKLVLADKMYSLGLRSKNGKRLDKNLTGRLLSNPFYMGLIRIDKTGETFWGAHQPLISKSLFDTVQKVLAGRHVGRKGVRHRVAYRRFLTCKFCARTMIPEIKKGHVYYRCHTSGCDTKTIREERVSEAIAQHLKQLKLTASELKYFDRQIVVLRKRWQETRRKLLESQQVRKNTIADRLNRLTDAFIDGHLDKESFDAKKTALLLERREIEDQLGNMQTGNFDVPSAIEKNLELIKTAYSLHKVAFSEEQREIVESVTSNRFVSGKTIEIPFKFPFSEVARIRGGADGGAPKVSRRTFCGKVLQAMHKYCEMFQSDPGAA